MKLTESHLRAIIKEELEALLSEERRETDPKESEEGYEGAEAAKRMKARIEQHRIKHPRESDDPEKNPLGMGPSSYRIAKAAGIEKKGLRSS